MLNLVYLSVGLTSSGYAQANLPLKPNTTYFTTLRGVTNDGNVLQTSSDGFTIDQSAPIIAIDRSDYQFYLKELDTSILKIRYALIKNFSIFFLICDLFKRYSLKVTAIYINQIFID